MLDPDNGATVNPSTRKRVGFGFAYLRAMWKVPDFDPE
jgi:hypothetical protein